MDYSYLVTPPTAYVPAKESESSDAFEALLVQSGFFLAQAGDIDFEAHHGVADASFDAYNAPLEYGTLESALDDAPTSYDASLDASLSAFDAFSPAYAVPMYAGPSEHPWHVTPTASDAHATQVATVNPADVCSLVPIAIPDFSQFVDEEEDDGTDFLPAPESLAGTPVLDGVATFDAEAVIDLCVRYPAMAELVFGQPSLPIAQPDRHTVVPAVEVPVAAAPSVTAQGKRKRVADGDDNDTLSAPSKKARCTDVGDAPHTTAFVRSSAPSPSPSMSHSPAPVLSSLEAESEPLVPIVVAPAGGYTCPMDKCKAVIEAIDSKWRNHFRTAHHEELGKGLHTCPLPHPNGGAGICGAGPMAADSLGRHALNVHHKVKHMCPLCGQTRVQRESACRRHMRTCKGKLSLKSSGGRA